MLSVANSPLGEACSEEFSVEERLALIERVAASAQLRRSARLRDFLLYVGTQSLKEGCPQIHEQEIGARVFGRPATYDRSQDNVVGVNATELRKRIEIYFTTEGADEPLILEIPRGAYKTTFRRRSVQNAAPIALLPTHPAESVVTPAAGLPHPAEPLPLNRPITLHLVWGAITLALAIACAALFVQWRTMRKALSPLEGKPAVQALWKDFLNSHRQTDIVLPDDSLSLIGDIDLQPVSLSEYLNRSYLRNIQSSTMSTDRKGDLDQIANHNLVTFGAIRAAEQIMALTLGSPSLNLALARYYPADGVKRNNVILIGGKKANPWSRLFEDQMNFTVDYDYAHVQAVVKNLTPQAGEPALYVVPIDPNGLVSYSVIAYLPNPSRTGNAIIIAGTDSDATGAAAEFLTSEEQLEKFQNILHTRQFPYFEALLKTARLSGTSFSAELVSYRTYPAPH